MPVTELGGVNELYSVCVRYDDITTPIAHLFDCLSFFLPDDFSFCRAFCLSSGALMLSAERQKRQCQ